MPHRSYRILGVVALSLLLVVAVMACGGGDDDVAPPPTATTSPTNTPVPPTAVPPTATSVPSDGGTAPTATPSGAVTTAPPSSSGAAAGAPAPEPYTGGEEIAATLLEIEMIAYGGSGQSGSATLVQIERKTRIQIDIAPGDGGPQMTLIRRGRCPEEGQPPEGQADYGLFDVVDGKSNSVVNTPTQFFQFNRDYIIVYGGTTEDSGIAACGNVPSVFG